MATRFEQAQSRKSKPHRKKVGETGEAHPKANQRPEEEEGQNNALTQL
jgi:hypothetical protein